MDGPVRRWLIVVCSVFVKGTGRERSYNPTMLGRSARKYLTPQQELIASQHFARLLEALGLESQPEPQRKSRLSIDVISL